MMEKQLIKEIREIAIKIYDQVLDESQEEYPTIEMLKVLKSRTDNAIKIYQQSKIKSAIKNA
jgi:hypothetical protein